MAAHDYLVRKINAIAEPLINEARSAKAAATEAARKMVLALHWKDFEVMVDLLFARLGWQRSTSIGKDRDIDMILEQPATGERAFVQVKSRAGQTELNDYIARFVERGTDRLFFICHSPRGKMTVPSAHPNVQVWEGSRLAEMVVAAGLFDWLMRRTA